MKLGKWITVSGDRKRELPAYPWDVSCDAFNRREWDIEPGDGLFTFRRSFSAREGLTSATLRITALGIYTAYCNGREVLAEDGGRDELMPLWTDYRARVFEKDYTIPCRVGENDVVVRVSDGWWTGRISFGFYGFQKPALCAEIILKYEDGAEELIPTDEGWDVTVAGPVLAADLWDGEYYDARIPDPVILPEAHEWEKAGLFDGFKGEIVPFVGAPVRVLEYRAPLTAVVWRDTVEKEGAPLGEILPLRRTVGDNCEAGVLRAGEKLLLDFGENLVGRPTIAVHAKDGTHVRTIFAEMKNDGGNPARGNDGPCGSLYTQNYRTARSRLHQVTAADGDRVEMNIFRPLHAYFGFRYIEVSASADVEILCITAEIISADLPAMGDFRCSNAEVNQFFSNVVRGMRGNYLSVPTDCPQRDERLGWTGDTQVFCRTGTYLVDTLPFFRKWLGDMRDSQLGYQGAYSSVVPRTAVACGHAAAWTDAGIIVPYVMWQMYGDRSILEEHYDSMESYMAVLAELGTDGPGTDYGDWLCYEETDKRYVSVCYYAYDADLMARISEVLGKADRVAHYRQIFSAASARFHRDYVKDGEISERSQTGYLLPIAFGMLTKEEEERAIAHLIEKIRANGDMLSSGFVGTGILAQTLSRIGRDNQAYSLLLQTRDPSWLYSVRQGATTVWERWNSYTREKGFGNVAMNSFNHYAYGAVAEWFFSGICGIRPDPERPGFDGHFILSPRPDTRTDAELPVGQERITMAEASFRGITSRWEYEGDTFVWRFTVPEGTARIEFPLLNGVETVELNGLRFSAQELGGCISEGKLICELPAGTYTMR